MIRSISTTSGPARRFLSARRFRQRAAESLLIPILFRVQFVVPPITEPYQLDQIDQGILHLLQQNARDTTAEEIAEQVDVDPSAVRDRIDKLEVDGVIESFQPEVNYEKAGLPLDVLFVCTAAPAELSTVDSQVLDLSGVVEVTKLTTDRRNLHVRAVNTTTGGVQRTFEDLYSLGVEVEDMGLVSQTCRQPFDHFGREVVADEDEE